MGLVGVTMRRSNGYAEALEEELCQPRLSTRSMPRQRLRLSELHVVPAEIALDVPWANENASATANQVTDFAPWRLSRAELDSQSEK